MCHAEVGERVPLSVSIFFPEKNISLIFSVTLGSRLFFILLQINLLSNNHSLEKKRDTGGTTLRDTSGLFGKEA